MIDYSGLFDDQSIPLPEITISKNDTALLVIDMQYIGAHPDFGKTKIALDNKLP